MIKQNLKPLLTCAALAITSHLHAQKLPNLQPNSIYLTENVKIDGKAVELGGTFNAYNRAIDCFYTLANDDKMLYLRVQSRQREISSKIVSGGITLSVGTSKNKADTNTVQITFPSFQENEWVSLSNSLSRTEKLAREATDKQTDVSALNKAFSASAKNIKVKGLPESQEEVISIYNDQNIKASAQFDSNVFYTYELQIPLSSIKALQQNGKSFKYNIRLNPPSMKPYQPGNGPPPPPVEMATGAVTDFWHEYTLAVKPQ